MPNKFYFLVLAILIAGIFGAGILIYKHFFTNEAQAGASHNVSGWAWSETIGWISFNNLTDGSSVDYGVKIENPTGNIANITGFAWSENIGWIKFNPTGPYPEAPNYSARVDMSTREISGWARACAGAVNPDCSGGTNPNSGGWDGWIKLRGTATDGSSYGVYIDDVPNPNEFRGWAWGGDVVGWISFNCKDGGNCSSSNYKVITSFEFNQPPTPQNLTVDATGPDNYCFDAAPGLGQVNFEWTYQDQDGDPQISFDFQVDNNQSFANPEVNRSFTNLSNPSGTINTQTVQVLPSGGSVGSDTLGYNTTYYWRVKVKDSQGNDSGWIQGPPFSLPYHAWPWPRFTFEPENPTAGEEVRFTDQSVCYTGPSSSPVPCKNVPATSYLWNFGDGNTSTQKGDVTHVYNQSGDYTVFLRVRDNVGECQWPKEGLIINVALPEYQEIIPF